MYPVGERFVIEIETVYGADVNFPDADMEKVPDVLYRVKGFNSLVFDESGLDRLERYKEPGVKLKATYDRAYAEGLEAAWDAARKILRHENNGGLWAFELCQIFDSDDVEFILDENSAIEAIDKIHGWEAKQTGRSAENEIRIGDEVNINGVTGVVFYIDAFEESVRYLTPDGVDRLTSLHIAIQSKTGKACPQLAEILGQMAGQKEE